VSATSAFQNTIEPCCAQQTGSFIGSRWLRGMGERFEGYKERMNKFRKQVKKKKYSRLDFKSLTKLLLDLFYSVVYR
jgi:hypothetical protein